MLFVSDIKLQTAANCRMDRWREQFYLPWLPDIINNERERDSSSRQVGSWMMSDAPPLDPHFWTKRRVTN